MGMKEDTVRNIGFTRRHISPRHHCRQRSYPGLGRFVGKPGAWAFGNIDQLILGRSIAAEIALHSREAGAVIRENSPMKKLAVQFNSVT